MQCGTRYAFVLKHAIQAMKANGGNATKCGGSIVNIASISSVIAQPGFVPYSTTKGRDVLPIPRDFLRRPQENISHQHAPLCASAGAILQMSRCVALDAGKHGIRVNAVCPGPILTEGTRRHAASQGKTMDEIVSEMTGHMIIHR